MRERSSKNSDTDSTNYNAFISYSTKDEKKAFKICASLEKKGLKCWIAPRDIRAGKEYPQEIIRGIEHSNCLVLILSKSANESPIVKKEVERAINYNRPVFPVRVEDVIPSGSLELLVSATHWINAWSGSFIEHVEELAKEINNNSGGASLLKLKPLSLNEKIHRHIQKRKVLLTILIMLIPMSMLISPIFIDDYDKKLGENIGMLMLATAEKAANDALANDSMTAHHKKRILANKGLDCVEHKMAGTTCSLNTYYDPSNPPIKKILFGNNKQNMDIEIYPGQPEKNHRVAVSNKGLSVEYLLPIELTGLVTRLEFADGEQSPTFTYEKNAKRRLTFLLTANHEDAPNLLLFPVMGPFYKDGGNWGFIPIVGDEVSDVFWSTFEGGRNTFTKDSGFYLNPSSRGSEIGASDWLTYGIAPPIRVTYKYTDGNSATYIYQPNWSLWLRSAALALERAHPNHLVSCNSRSTNYHGYNKFNIVTCNISATEPLNKIISEVYWGFTPDNMKELRPDNRDKILQRYRESKITENKATKSDLNFGTPVRPRPTVKESEIIYNLNSTYGDWRDDENDKFGKKKFNLITLEPTNKLFFKFHLTDNTESSIIKVRVDNYNQEPK